MQCHVIFYVTIIREAWAKIFDHFVTRLTFKSKSGHVTQAQTTSSRPVTPSPFAYSTTKSCTREQTWTRTILYYLSFHIIFSIIPSCCDRKNPSREIFCLWPGPVFTVNLMLAWIFALQKWQHSHTHKISCYCTVSLGVLKLFWGLRLDLQVDTPTNFAT